MDLLEHQGKKLFAAAGLPVLASTVAVTPAEAVEATRRLGLPAVVKAQVKTGGRGKAGGVRLCQTRGEVEAAAAEILARTIKDKPVELTATEFKLLAMLLERRGRVQTRDRREPDGHPLAGRQREVALP